MMTGILEEREKGELFFSEDRYIILFSLPQKEASQKHRVSTDEPYVIMGFFAVQEEGKLRDCSSRLIIVMLEDFV